jgi:DNA polymerase III delta prime subunit
VKHTVWVERYRPKTIDDVIFQDTRQEQFFKSIVESGDMPHLLLQGVQGTGKTTVSKAIVKDLKIDPQDVLLIKCSNEKIEALRNKVEGFVNTYPVGKFKVVRLEEFDFMSLDGMGLLRSLIEDGTLTCRFIATCNYVNKILPPLRSRFQEFFFKKPDQDKVALRMAEILEAEKIEYTAEDLLAYVSVGYPDIRKTINLLQQNSKSGKLLSPTSNEVKASDWKFQLLDLVSSGNWKTARKLVCESASREEHGDVYTFFYENVDRMKVKSVDQAIIIINQYAISHGQVADTELNLAACMIELSQS